LAVFSLLDQFSPVERANLAVFCYRKAHLNRVGLAIAATCDRDTLIAAWGIDAIFPVVARQEFLLT
jgi:hypothetical protein